MTKYKLDWLGCKVNSYECQAFKKFLNENNYYEDELNPEIVIINTCSVTATSDKKSRQLINKYRKNYPNAIICAMGCFPQGSDNESLKAVNADIIIGTSNRKKIINYIELFNKNHNQIIDINKDIRNFEYEDFAIIDSSEITRAYVKIQDGCDKYCSYCLIPYVRGKSRSRNSDEIISEINNLVQKGYKEIVIIGIDVASYGLDFENKITFSDLLEMILLNCKDLYRIRISSIEESMIDDKFINLLKNNPKIASHMHLSLQSGSNSVLKRMNRKYTSEEFYKKVLCLRDARKDINLTTDVIVGFPGETEEEFKETYDFLKKCEFSHLHVFPFSPRKGTVAYNMKDQIPSDIKNERVNKLLELSKITEEKYNSKFRNVEMEFLIESYDEKSLTYTARSSNYLELKVKGEKNLYKIGDIYKLIF